MKYFSDVDVSKIKVQQPEKRTVSLFGKDVSVYDDEWRNHLHVVCTHRCNAKCNFCIEKNSPREETNILKSLETFCKEAESAGILKTVGFTGGEPTLCKNLYELQDIIPKKVFKTINTNGRDLKLVRKTLLMCVFSMYVQTKRTPE